MYITLTQHLLAGGGYLLLSQAEHTATHGCLAFDQACDEVGEATLMLVAQVAMYSAVFL